MNHVSLTAIQSYGPPIRVAPSDSERIAHLIARLRRVYTGAPTMIRVVRAPLRICPLGAHIDHQLGVVTGMTINESILMAFAPTDDGSIYVESLNFEQPVTFTLHDAPAYRRGDWGNYVRGAALALQQQHRLSHGLMAIIDGQMPIGGLSSSAAVTIAYLLALEAVNSLALTPADNVGHVRYTENRYIGLNNGILDQSVILFSAPNHLTRIDCQTIAIDRTATPARLSGARPDCEILVVYSGVTHVLVGTDYNNRVAECQEAARLLLDYSGQAASPDPRLRHVEPQVFQREHHRLPERLQRRARHFFGEMQRVQEGVRAWEDGDLRLFGQLMNESGESSIKYYECGSPQLITLYETLAATPGVYGARFSGAGFRGNCIAFIDPAARERIAAAVHQRYPAAHPGEAARYSIHFCQPDGCAQLLDWAMESASGKQLENLPNLPRSR